jgi:hypothetical protein
MTPSSVQIPRRGIDCCEKLQAYAQMNAERYVHVTSHPPCMRHWRPGASTSEPTFRIPRRRVVTSPGRGRRPTTPSPWDDSTPATVYVHCTARRGHCVRARVQVYARHTPRGCRLGWWRAPAAHMLAFPAPNRTTGGRVAQMHSAMPMRYLPPAAAASKVTALRILPARATCWPFGPVLTVRPVTSP